MSSDHRTRDFERVALCHLDLVYRIALQLTGDVHTAEDLVQETFLRAHRAFDRFELREYGAKPWLLRILHNVFFTRCGTSARAPTMAEDMSLDDIAAELELTPVHLSEVGEPDWELFDEELKAAVMAMPPDHRAVLLLWALGDLSYKEIAKVLGCAMGTVMSRLFRARQQLGVVLAEFAAASGVRPRPERDQK
ncbi:MAG: sigma-70 family RNA polymerase sigma factor [Phycisphaerae bacterium]|nr:sigma-70 family RNA polymerase sigma factor [Phycisphaerae bacterium]